MRAKTDHSRRLHSGRVFDVFQDRVTLENGSAVEMDIIRHPGAAAMVPLAANRTVLLLRQFRYAVGETIWEIPAGTFSPQETPLECARRELLEETGYAAGKWKKLAEIIPVPGYSDERVHLFLAWELTRGRQNLDADEILEVHRLPFDAALEMVFEGKIKDAKTITALMLAAEKLKTSPPSNF